MVHRRDGKPNLLSANEIAREARWILLYGILLSNPKMQYLHHLRSQFIRCLLMVVLFNVLICIIIRLYLKLKFKVPILKSWVTPIPIKYFRVRTSKGKCTHIIGWFAVAFEPKHANVSISLAGSLWTSHWLIRCDDCYIRGNKKNWKSNLNIEHSLKHQ